MLKAVLFDLDGTLINSEEYYINGTYEWISKLDSEVKREDLFPLIGKDEDSTYKFLEGISGIAYDTCKKENEKYFFVEHPINFKELLFDDVKDTFKYLKEKGLRIAICSMSPYNYIKQFVEECDLTTYVDYYISGADCKHNKPDPEIYLKALDFLHISADEALVVEDAPVGISSGLAAGVRVIARDDSRFKLDQSKAELVLEDLRKLNTII